VLLKGMALAVSLLEKECQFFIFLKSISKITCEILNLDGTK
jgi:hypothetical protein